MYPPIRATPGASLSSIGAGTQGAASGL